jgi:hypothetical protein
VSDSPTDWFRVRHDAPFSEAAYAAFRAGCAIFQARIEATLENWAQIPSLSNLPKPKIAFLEPELSADRRVMSLPIHVEGQTIGSRSLLQTAAAAELHLHLPPPVLLEVEVGVTEPGFDASSQWRHDWWDPWRPRNDAPSPELLADIRRRGGRVVTGDQLPDVLAPVQGWAWLRRRICRSLLKWCRDA